MLKIISSLLLLGLLGAPFCSLQAQERLRLIIETDAGGDPDDEQSLVRFLLYVNEWDVEGIIANRPKAREGENRNKVRTGLGIVRQQIDAYGVCWSNLVQHDRRYPTAEQLHRLTVPGDNDQKAGEDLLIAAVDRADPRPLWYSDWGTDEGAATNNLRRVLDRILRERGPERYARFKSKLRITAHDKFGPHTSQIDPPFVLWVNTFEPALDGKRWYHRFSALTARAGGFDLGRDVLNDHGPLGALYPTNTTHWQKEGDSGTFLYLVPTGMNDPDQPGWGSWAGRYGPNEKFPGRPYYWANQPDRWNGTVHRENSLLRFAADLQNDFRARLDWCVRSYREANHPPEVRLSSRPRSVRAGEELLLDATPSRDPDGQAVKYNWSLYPEASTYRESFPLGNTSNATLRLVAPTDSAGKTIHLLLSVTDSGTPPLTRYQRLVLAVEPSGKSNASGKPE